MSWCNNYSPPPKIQLSEEELYGPEPYNLNFCFPIDESTLENERVKLTPYIPRLHAQAFFDVMSTNPQLSQYLFFHPAKTLREHLEQYEGFRRDPVNLLLFVIIDKTRARTSGAGQSSFEDGSFAGVIGLVHTSESQLCTEIGPVIIFPEFQRTHVLSNAAGLLLCYCLNLPSDFPSGIGLRRVQWCTNSLNTPSLFTAARLGFQHEGLHKWYMALPEGKEGNPTRPGDRHPESLGRDSVTLSICWDDWDAGTREKVREAMERTS